MKKIILKEDKKSPILSKYIKNGIQQNKHSLSNNPCFPPSDEKMFDEFIINCRFNELVDKINKFNDIEELTPTYLIEKLKTISEKIKVLENGNEEKLITVCKNVITKLFGEYENDIDLNINITQAISRSKINIPKTPVGTTDFEFDSIDKMNEIEKYIYKKRFLNSLIQGSANYYSQNIKLFLNEIYEINSSLPELYEQGMLINDLLYFINKYDVNDNISKCSGIVNVKLSTKNKSQIDVEGVNFPSILNETIKGFMELFTTHGLPSEKEVCKFIISKSDFLYAEPWDIRFGYPLWSIIFSSVEESRLIPNIYTQLISINIDHFFIIMKEILAKTKKGKDFFNNLKNTINIDYNLKVFNNTEDCSDKYMTLDELNECNL